MSKAELAQMLGRHPSAVSHWIAAGKLTPPALVGQGRYAKIDVELALAQLGIALDFGQQMAQAAPIAPAIAPPAASPGLVPGLNPGILPAAPNDQVRYQKAKADNEEAAAHLAMLKAKAHDGRWLEVAAAEAAWERQLAGMMQQLETALPQLGEQLANELGGDHKRLTAAIRQWFRVLRARLHGEALGADRDVAMLEAAE